MSFLAMGGYAAFIWPAFGVAAVVLIGLFLVSWREARAREAELEAMPSSGRAERRERSKRS